MGVRFPPVHVTFCDIFRHLLSLLWILPTPKMHESIEVGHPVVQVVDPMLVGSAAHIEESAQHTCVLPHMHELVSPLPSNCCVQAQQVVVPHIHQLGPIPPVNCGVVVPLLLLSGVILLGD